MDVVEAIRTKRAVRRFAERPLPEDATRAILNAGRQAQSWILPRGGSGELTRALVQAFEDLGGTLLLNKHVSALVVENGRCTGVETDDGDRYTARKAVVSTIHVKHLVDMAPVDAAVDPAAEVRALAAELKKYDPALARKPRWLVFNKADLLDPEERGQRAQALVKKLRWTKPWFVISAIDGEGCKALTYKVMELLESERRSK